MGNFKKWGDDFEMGGWYPFMDYACNYIKKNIFHLIPFQAIGSVDVQD